MERVEEFYSVTGSWWGAVESLVDDVDRRRAEFVAASAPDSRDVLEIGCGYGSTAVAVAETGRNVVGVDISSRIEQVPSLADGSGSLQLMRGDFNTVILGRSFDVVAYWNGFGVGTDDDQIRLLRRIVDDWLGPGGTAIVEAFNPIAWAADDGLFEVKEPDLGLGYEKRLGHRRSFSKDTSTALDTWWEIGSEQTWTQSLRCYSPDEMVKLARRAGLTVTEVAGLDSPTSSAIPLIDETCWSYACVMRRN